MAKKDIKMAMAAVRSNRARSILTVFGVVVAVAAVTTVVSMGHGIQKSIVQQANKYSANVITVRPAPIGSAGGLAGIGAESNTATVTQKDIDAINKIPSVSETVPLTVVGTTVRGDNTFNGIVYAVDNNLPDVVNQEIAFGAFFTSSEANNNVAVLGADAAEAMFDQNVPLGRAFTIRGQQFIVAGVLNKFETTPLSSGGNFNNAIFVPEASAASLAPNGTSIAQALVKIKNGTNLEQADKQISDAMARNHGNYADVGVYTPAELAQRSTVGFGLLTTLVVAAAAIILLVSGVGIMNVMLVSITERIHEIGIRKAVGATNRQIRNQFLTEAFILCLIGSIVGVIGAFVLCFLIGAFTDVRPSFSWQAAGLTSLAACAFGVIFGTIPAVKAARKDPIAALRNQ